MFSSDLRARGILSSFPFLFFLGDNQEVFRLYDKKNVTKETNVLHQGDCIQNHLVKELVCHVFSWNSLCFGTCCYLIESIWLCIIVFLDKSEETLKPEESANKKNEEPEEDDDEEESTSEEESSSDEEDSEESSSEEEQDDRGKSDAQKKREKALARIQVCYIWLQQSLQCRVDMVNDEHDSQEFVLTHCCGRSWLSCTFTPQLFPFSLQQFKIWLIICTN